MNTVGRSLNLKQSLEQECRSSNNLEKDTYEVLNLLSFLSGWASMHPQITPQLKEEIFDLIARYVENPKPDIHLRVPVSQDLWSRFVQACGKDGYYVEHAINIFLLTLEEYAKMLLINNNIEKHNLYSNIQL